MLTPAALLPLLLALAADAGAPGVEVREEPYETFVTARAPGRACPSVEWRRKSRELRLHRCPGKTFTDEGPALRALLGRLRAQEGPAVAEGRLLIALDYFSHPAFVARLARHAQKARDRQPGQSINQYVVSAASAADLLPELTQILAGIGRRPLVSSAEKCSEARPRGKGEMSAWLRAQGFRGKEPLPMGCLMVWVRLVE